VEPKLVAVVGDDKTDMICGRRAGVGGGWVHHIYSALNKGSEGTAPGPATPPGERGYGPRSRHAPRRAV